MRRSSTSSRSGPPRSAALRRPASRVAGTGIREITRHLVRGMSPPHGHYAHAVEHAGVLYVSGVLGNAESETLGRTRSVDEQASYCLESIERILLGVGSARERVIRLTVYTTEVLNWPVINARCADFFGVHRPARTIVPCGELRLGSAVEMDVIAAARRARKRT